ncbi:MAG: phosphatase PAP2 family protein [Burkholderiaceae bacterium]|jgi:undecaprenyl-diphosphatase|nr:phosphatase PAP2 family protein [Burkholderiaceae bacterium]
MNTVEAFNQALFLSINGSAATPHWVVGLALVCAKYLVVLVPLLLVGMWLTGREEERGLALRSCLAILLALAVNGLIGLAWPHPRPFMIGLGHLFLPHAPSPSFPSDHATGIAALAVILLAGGQWWRGIVTVAVGVAVAWARVFVGVHVPLDMLGAVVVGCLVCAALAPLWRWRGRALTQGAVALYGQLFALPIRLGWLRP